MALQEAKNFEEKMRNRVKYLAREEQKLLKKILKSREEAEKRAQLKKEKLQYLQEK